MKRPMTCCKWRLELFLEGEARDISFDFAHLIASSLLCFRHRNWHFWKLKVFFSSFCKCSDGRRPQKCSVHHDLCCSDDGVNVLNRQTWFSPFFRQDSLDFVFLTFATISLESRFKLLLIFPNQSTRKIREHKTMRVIFILSPLLLKVYL
jgi:hypothetical protein